MNSKETGVCVVFVRRQKCTIEHMKCVATSNQDYCLGSTFFRCSPHRETAYHAVTFMQKCEDTQRGKISLNAYCVPNSIRENSERALGIL